MVGPLKGSGDLAVMELTQVSSSSIAPRRDATRASNAYVVPAEAEGNKIDNF